MLNRAGFLVLAAGLGAAVWIWHAQDVVDRQKGGQSAEVSALDSRKYARDVEIYYGKSGILMEQAQAYLQGKGLAKTVAVASILTATGLFLFAARLIPEQNE